MKLNKTQRGQLEAKRKAVVARLEEIKDRIDLISGIWDERQLDALILVLGIGKVTLDDDQ